MAVLDSAHLTRKALFANFAGQVLGLPGKLLQIHLPLLLRQQFANPKGISGVREPRR